MKSLAKVILLTKDAYDTIESFIKYYGYLFDINNIVIIDNGSTDQRVHAVYRKYANDGLRVIIDRSAFATANVFMSKYMLELNDSCEFILPMETDEFLFIMPKGSDDTYAIMREDVHNYLKSLPQNVSVVRYGAFLASSVCVNDPDYKNNNHMYSNPPMQMTKFWNQGWDKIIVRANAFINVKQWLHHVEVSSGIKIISDVLGLLHFHDTGMRRTWERTLPLVSLSGFGYIDFTMPENIQLGIAKYYKDQHAPGYHRLEYFYNILRRKLIAEMFNKIIGRLPAPDEVRFLCNVSPYMELVLEKIIHHSKQFRLTQIANHTIDDVMFNELTNDHQYQICQVSNRLKIIFNN